MQQLNNWDLQQDKLYLQFSAMPTEEALLTWLSSLAKQASINVLEVSAGADRVQAIFRFEQVDCLFQAEFLCEAVWIELLTSQNDFGQIMDRLEKLCQGVSA